MPIWIVLISWVTKIILALLIGLSIWSISIMLDRRRVLKKQDEEKIEEALNLLKAKNFAQLSDWAKSREGLRAAVVRASLEAGDSTEAIDRQVRSAMAKYRVNLDKGLSVLASLGSNAPFIGLFGTVLGIIQAFGALAFEQSNMNIVMASISEALVATAVGLFVAIPALTAYNYYARRIKMIVIDCESYRDLFVAVKNNGR